LAYRLGRHWGDGLLRGVILWERFVGYLGEHLIDAGALYQSEFQRGFVAGYGTAGPVVWTQALTDARLAATAGPVTVSSEYGTVTVR